MKNRIRIVIALLMVVTCRSLEAQPSQDLVNRMMPKPVPASPNVAALGKFGDYQVSHFSGLPEISIPVYEAQSGGLKLPITLSYHASGVKPTDQASWVGLGWSLSAGGQISRAVVGKADEEGFLSEALNPNPSVCGTYAYLLHAATGVSDTEADVFSYSFGGNSGRFLWTYDSGPYLIPYAPININAPANSFARFDITDENGILYKFGEDAAGARTSLNPLNPGQAGTSA